MAGPTPPELGSREHGMTFRSPSLGRRSFSFQLPVVPRVINWLLPYFLLYNMPLNKMHSLFLKDKAILESLNWGKCPLLSAREPCLKHRQFYICFPLAGAWAEESAVTLFP